MADKLQSYAELLPSKDLFYDGRVPEPLSEEERQWLVEQLHAWPNRVNEQRTCAIGALTEMAVTEFCRLMVERSTLRDRCIALEGALEPFAEAYAQAEAACGGLCLSLVETERLRAFPSINDFRRALRRLTPKP